MPGSCHQRARLTRAYNLARKRGAAAGDSLFDGNSTISQARAFILGHDAGDPVVMDLQPNPLAICEWADETLADLFDFPAGAADPTEDEQNEYLNNFIMCWWGAALAHAGAIMEGTE